MTERDAYIALNLMDRVGPVTARALREALGSLCAVFEASERALLKVQHVGKLVAETIVLQRGSIDVIAEIERASEMGARILTPVDNEYPRPLKSIYDPPLALYVQGRLLARDQHAIAIVGTRRPTRYGMETARQLARELARAGHTIVSGLATGIDTAAHTGALEAKGRTVGVIGGGLDCLTPRSNATLAEEMAGKGAVLTEFPIGRRPDKTTFPMRNRLVSGLSKGTVVVEAASRSGALITAEQAMQQGRTVFAVPGRIDTVTSQGTHALIRDGASLVRCAEDITAEFETLFESTAEQMSVASPPVSSDEARILEALTPGDVTVDQLIRATDMNAASVNTILLGLEMKKLVRILPGRVIERVGRNA